MSLSDWHPRVILTIPSSTSIGHPAERRRRGFHGDIRDDVTRDDSSLVARPPAVRTRLFGLLCGATVAGVGGQALRRLRVPSATQPALSAIRHLSSSAPPACDPSTTIFFSLLHDRT